jgi:hypothetical protein
MRLGGLRGVLGSAGADAEALRKNDRDALGRDTNSKAAEGVNRDGLAMSPIRAVYPGTASCGLPDSSLKGCCRPVRSSKYADRLGSF